MSYILFSILASFGCCVIICSGQYLAGVGTDSIPCVSGFEPHGQSCYRFINISYNWVEAATTCDMMHAHLVEINTAEENTFITQLVQNETKEWRQDALGERIWTGGTNMQGHLLWLPSHNDVSYSSWHTGEPYTRSGNVVYCVLKMQRDWYADRCKHERNFVCEKELNGLGIPRPTAS